MNRLKNSDFRNLISAALLCFGFSAARAYDPSKPWIYSMRFMMDTWGYLEMYSTATVVSKPSNFAAFRVVTSTTNPTYQLLVTTQGNVGISTGAPTQKLEVSGMVYSSAGGFKFPDGSTQTAAGIAAPSSPQAGDLLYYDGSGWTRLAAGTDASQSLKPIYDGYTKLVLHMEGAGSSFTDSATGKTVTAGGNVTQTSVQYKIGSKSAYFDGTGDYLTLEDSDDWYFGSGDFTMDFWVRPSNYAMFIGQWVDSNNYWTIDDGGTGQIEVAFMVGGTVRASYVTGNVLTYDAWNHIAVVRNGSNFYIFLNGVSQNPAANVPVGTGDLGNFSGTLQIGSRRGIWNDYCLNGWLDELRVSKGIARWTANFTPQSSPYTATSIGWQ